MTRWKAPRGEAGVRWLDGGLRLGVALALVLTCVASAEAAEKLSIEVMVSRVSDRPGGIDERARKLHEKLSKTIRYESLEVLDTTRLTLALDQVGSVSLPNGKTLRMRPLQRDGGSVFLAVQVGQMSSDLRLTNGHLVVWGAGTYQDGKLVISFEPHW